LVWKIKKNFAGIVLQRDHFDWGWVLLNLLDEDQYNLWYYSSFKTKHRETFWCCEKNPCHQRHLEKQGIEFCWVCANTDAYQLSRAKMVCDWYSVDTCLWSLFWSTKNTVCFGALNKTVDQ
jgi:hypothetical protein